MGEPGYGPRGTERERLVEEVEALLRRVTVESQRLGHEFASRHGLHPTDFEALVHVMDAQGAGAPLTPGELAAKLRLSSGATTAVVDRLEKQGHIRRDRDDVDRRKLHLRWAEHGMAVAMDFFGRLVPLQEEVMGPMSDADLAVVRRFLAGMADGLAAHRQALDDEPAP
ncbi:MAG: MarR family transcriptional regulator [Actinobacteria bacterium]|nr:MarR family transcriptional regulator [Actinomycetota bacterium]